MKIGTDSQIRTDIAIDKVSINGKFSRRNETVCLSSVSRRLLSIALVLPFTIAPVAPIWAQDVNTTKDLSTASQKVYRLNIPIKPLPQAIAELSAQTGLQVLYAEASTFNHKSPALQGNYSVREALQQLTAGSGLVVQFTGGNAVTLKLASQTEVEILPSIQVSGSAIHDGSSANAYRVEEAKVGVLGSTKLQNTPYSVEAFSREFIDNRQAHSLSEVAKYDAAISISNDNKISENNAFSIRGIKPDGDTGQKIDGMNLRSRATDLPLEHIEQVDILKGAGGFLYGFGAPGGIVNYVLKRPTGELMRSVSTQVTDTGSVLLHGDVGGRFGIDKRFGYRINIVGESGETYVNDADSDRKSASVALDWRINPDLIWQVDGLYANRKSYGGYWVLTPNSDGLPGNWGIAEPPAPIDGSQRLAPEWMLYESEHQTLGTDLLWRFSEQWDMKLSHRYSSSYRYLTNPGIFADSAGNYSIQSWNYNNFFESNQTQGVITGALETGFIQHNVTAGLSYNETVSSNSDDLGTGLIITNVGNLSDPVDFPNSLNPLSTDDAKYKEFSSVIRKEFFLSDTLNVGANWDLIIGARYGNIEDEYGDYSESAITPSLAAIYRPREWVSLYASYIEAFQQGSVASSSAANAGEVFDPLISTQYETGMKVEKENWSTNVALFRLNRGITYIDSNNVFHQDEGARYEGLEVSARSRLGNNWLVGVSAMWLDTTDREGNDIAGIASEQYRVFGEFDVPQSEWVLTGGASYTGERPLVSSGEIEVGSVTLLDIGARYQLNINGAPVTLRANVDNLTDEAYWVTQAGGGRLTQGTPRTMKIGLQMEF